MQLKHLIARLKTEGIEGSLEREITGLAYDSRRVTPGMVFLALRGEHVDGHDYIQSAVDRGAVAVICEQNGFIPHRATQIKVTNSRQAMALVAAEFYGHPSTRLTPIGITGTNGKTTVAFMLKHILETAGMKTGLLGTIRYEIGERVLPAQRTTPESLEIHQMMAQMVRAGCRACVMEVSSHALDQQRVYGIDYAVTLFTNLTQDHLDYHRDLETYYRAKRRLFTAGTEGKKPGAAIINIDDAFGQRLVKETEAAVVVTYGAGQTAQVRASHIQLGPESIRMEVHTVAERFDCELPLIGRHNVYNALAAIGAALVLKVDAKLLPKALATQPPVPGRLERLVLGQPFGVLVDYAHTEDALRKVLVTLREITPGRLLLAIGCGGSRDTGKRPKMGQAAAELADVTVITSDNPRRESPEAIARAMERGYLAVRPRGYRIELDRRRAIEELIRQAQPGDTVLLAGKGHETYQEFADTVIPFDDRVYAQETLEGLGYRPRRG